MSYSQLVATATIEEAAALAVFIERAARRARLSTEATRGRCDLPLFARRALKQGRDVLD
jgi:hypothetical protein